MTHKNIIWMNFKNITLRKESHTEKTICSQLHLYEILKQAEFI